jgi:hypothetical protein
MKKSPRVILSLKADIPPELVELASNIAAKTSEEFPDQKIAIAAVPNFWKEHLAGAIWTVVKYVFIDERYSHACSYAEVKAITGRPFPFGHSGLTSLKKVPLIDLRHVMIIENKTIVAYHESHPDRILVDQKEPDQLFDPGPDWFANIDPIEF